MIVTRASLAQIFDVNVSTIDAWVRRGMPSLKKSGKGNPSEYESSACIQWRLTKQLEEALMSSGAYQTNSHQSNSDQTETQQASAQELKRRRLEAETIIAELDQEKKMIELAEKKKQLVFIEDANANIIDAVTTLRQRLLTIPRRLTPLVLGETNDRTVHSKIEKEITDALADISRTYAREAKAAEDSAP